MVDLRQNPEFDLRTLNAGDRFIGEDGVTYEVTANTEDTFAYVSVPDTK